MVPRSAAASLTVDTLFACMVDRRWHTASQCQPGVPMIDVTSPEFQRAVAEDRRVADDLAQTLREQGRGGHPAMEVLTRFVEGPATQGEALEAAAIAFEAAVRVHFGAIGGHSVRSGQEIALPMDILVSRDAMPWEPPEKQGWPHLVVDWRAAVGHAARAALRGGFRLPEIVPGAALGTLVIRETDDDAALECLLEGEAPRCEVFDPVATGGGFLAQVIPNFIDLDLELRLRRERSIAAA